MISRQPQATDMVDASFKNRLKRLQECRQVQFDILEFVGTAVDDNYRDGKATLILLERQVPIHCYERVELGCG